MAKKPAKGTPLYQESEVGNTGFGLRLRYNREAKRLSVEELASLAGVNAITLKEAERGNRVTLPLLKIAEILDLDLHWFRYGSDRKYENEKEHQLSEHILALMLEASKAPRGADRNAFLYVLADALDYEHLSEELTEQVPLRKHAERPLRSSFAGRRTVRNCQRTDARNGLRHEAFGRRGRIAVAGAQDGY